MKNDGMKRGMTINMGNHLVAMSMDFAPASAYNNVISKDRGSGRTMFLIKRAQKKCCKKDATKPEMKQEGRRASKS